MLTQTFISRHRIRALTVRDYFGRLDEACGEVLWQAVSAVWGPLDGVCALALRTPPKRKRISRTGIAAGGNNNTNLQTQKSVMQRDPD